MGKRENKLEKYLNSEVEKLGGVTRKYVSPEHVGVADRLCFLPEGRLIIIEVKTEAGKESGPQKREREKMTDLGFRAVILYGKKEIDQWLMTEKWIHIGGKIKERK